MKKLILLGSTGSIGRQALEVAAALPEEFTISSLAAGNNAEEMIRQIGRFRPASVAMADRRAAAAVQAACPKLRVFSGEAGVRELCETTDADMALVAVVGAVGLPLTMTCIRRGMDIALANKETMVTGGPLVQAAVQRQGVRLYPVDSEHSAIAQCLEGSPAGSVERLLLTASGGPFRGMGREELAYITLERALQHPTWNMGARVTIDSASLVNKGMEVMEARWLFDIPPERISVLVHPQSIVHSMVEFRDGAVLAQLGVPDMRLPIQWALTGKRRLSGPVHRLTPEKMASLTFELPDMDTFRGLPLAFDALRSGQGACVAYNAADELAVAAFLTGRIRFPEIYGILEQAMEAGSGLPCTSVEEVLAADCLIRRKTQRYIERTMGN